MGIGKSVVKVKIVYVIFLCNAPLKFCRMTYFLQVLTVGQKVTFEYLGNNFLFTVNQAVIEGQEKSDSERGLLSADTYVIFEAAGGSGIKVRSPYLCLNIYC